MTVSRPAMPFDDAFHFVTVTLAYFLLFAFTEALCFQGLVLTVASRYAGPTAAAVIAALAFGFAHVPSPGLGAIGIATLIVTGFGLALMVRITGSIWWNVGFLAAFDWVQRVFYGNPPRTSLPYVQVLVSSTYGDEALTGGTYGIEASVLMLPVALAAVAVLVCIVTKRNPVRGVAGAARTALAACAPAARIF